MTITKFERDKDENDVTHRLKKKKVLHIRRKSPSFNDSKVIYAFESFDAFCNFCIFLSSRPYKSLLESFAESSVLYEYNSNYYLIFTNINLNLPIASSICQSITEFAYFIDNAELFEKKVLEYRKSYYKITRTYNWYGSFLYQIRSEFPSLLILSVYTI